MGKELVQNCVLSAYVKFGNAAHAVDVTDVKIMSRILSKNISNTVL